jgi:hypothetical protein
LIKIEEEVRVWIDGQVVSNVALQAPKVLPPLKNDRVFKELKHPS